MAAAKDRHRANMLKYLSNPDNDFPKRDELAAAIGIAERTLYHHFTPDELRAIEAEALSLRRDKYAPQLAKVDKALLDRAAEGDPQAIKLAYQRFERWAEAKRHEHTGSEGGPIEHDHKHELSPEVREKLDEIYGSKPGA